MVTSNNHINPPIHSICVIIIHIENALLQFGASLGLIDGHFEQVDVGVERELVHGIHATHVVQHEEQDGRSLRRRTIALKSDICILFLKFMFRRFSDLEKMIEI